jgi:hypothetical protein
MVKNPRRPQTGPSALLRGRPEWTKSQREPSAMSVPAEETDFCCKFDKSALKSAEFA